MNCHLTVDRSSSLQKGYESVTDPDFVVRGEGGGTKQRRRGEVENKCAPWYRGKCHNDFERKESNIPIFY